MIIVEINIDKYWALKQSLFCSAIFFAILLNYYLFDGNYFLLFWIVFVFELIRLKVPPSPRQLDELAKSITVTKN